MDDFEGLDFTAEDWKDFDKLGGKGRPCRRFIDDERNDEGFWKGKPLSGMTVSHLRNTVKLLNRWREDDSYYPFIRKIAEMEAELKSRANGNVTFGLGDGVNRFVVRKNSFVVTTAMILDAARAAGLKIPASGAGVYFGDRKVTDGDIEIRFDTTHTVKPPKAKKVRKGKKS